MDVVYFLQINHDLVKIGKTGDLNQRMAKLKKEYPNSVITKQFYTDDCHTLEKTFHNIFKSSKIKKPINQAQSRELYSLNISDRIRVKSLPFFFPSAEKYYIPVSTNNPVEKQRTTLNLDPVLYDQVSTFASDNNLSTSSIYNAALKTFLNSAPTGSINLWHAHNRWSKPPFYEPHPVSLDFDLYLQYKTQMITYKTKMYEVFDKLLNAYLSILLFYRDYNLFNTTEFMKNSEPSGCLSLNSLFNRPQHQK